MTTERKGPKRALSKKAPRGSLTTASLHILRLPPRTWSCTHDRAAVCDRCVEGINLRSHYRTELARGPVVLRLDCWRASSDSMQRKAAGMQELKTTMAELQRQDLIHKKYICDGCIHCKENSNAE